MEFKVLIHGVDVIENVLSDARDDTFTLQVMEVPLCEGRWKQKNRPDIIYNHTVPIQKPVPGHRGNDI